MTTGAPDLTCFTPFSPVDPERFDSPFMFVSRGKLTDGPFGRMS